MPGLFKEFASQWQMVKPAALTVGMHLKYPLDDNTTMKGLTHIGKNFPQLRESKFKEEGKLIILTNGEDDWEKELLFAVIEHKALQLAWGPLVEGDFHSLSKSLYDCVQEGFDLFPVNVELIDVKYYVKSDWCGNHYQVICEAFLKNTPLESVFELNRILGNDLSIRGLLKDNRVCVIRVDSDVADSEILKGNFKNDTLRALVGVAQTKDIPLDAQLSSVFEEHSQVAIKFIKEKFIPSIIEPLDKALVKVSKEKKG